MRSATFFPRLVRMDRQHESLAIDGADDLHGLGNIDRRFLNTCMFADMDEPV